MKYARLAIGIGALSVALWVIVGEQMSGASADAVVNAPVVTLRAPVAGNLTLPDRQVGAWVNTGEMLASLQDPLVDRIRLNDLTMELRLEEASLARTKAALSEAQALRTGLAERAATYHAKRLEELQTRLEHAQRRLDFLEANGLSQDAAARNLRDLDPGEPPEDFLTLDHARERVAVLRIALAAAQQTVFLGDGYNDAPHSEQRLSALSQEIATLTAAQTESEARVAAVKDRADRERVRVNNAGAAELRTPVDGIYWEILQADGVTLQRGDPVLRLLDCKSSLVTLSVSERVYNGLTLGQAANFRLSGTSELYEGTVSRLAGSGAETIYRNLAVAPSQKHLERFDVSLVVPRLQEAEGEGCLIGRTGRVFFETRPLDWLRGLFG